MTKVGDLRFLCFVCILFCASLFHAQFPPARPSDGALAGKITDTFEVPIGGAYVQVRSKTRPWRTSSYTDQFGNFKFSLAPGDYELSVVGPGFVPEFSVVSIASGKTTQHDSKLKIDVKHLEESHSR